MKKKEKTQKFVKLCPRCGSMNITSQGIISLFVTTAYKCRNCSYRGNIIEVEESKVEKFLNAVKRKVK